MCIFQINSESENCYSNSFGGKEQQDQKKKEKTFQDSLILEGENLEEAYISGLSIPDNSRFWKKSSIV